MLRSRGGRTALLIALVFLSTFATLARASDVEPPATRSVSFGHVVSSTTSLLRSGECTIGAQVAGCGLSDRVMVGASPWLLYDYGLISIFGRMGLGDAKARPDGRLAHDQSIQLSYFRNYVGADDGKGFGYDMSLAWGTYVYALRPAPNYSIYLNAQAMHYWIDRHPFSLRRPWVDRTPLQLNASALIEAELSNGFYLNGEVGLLGLAQQAPAIHIGVSLDWRSPSWLFRAGVSQSGTLRGYRSPPRRRDHQQDLRSTPEGFDKIYPEYAQYDYSVHPEITVQWYF